MHGKQIEINNHQKYLTCNKIVHWENGIWHTFTDPNEFPLLTARFTNNDQPIVAQNYFKRSGQDPTVLQQVFQDMWNIYPAPKQKKLHLISEVDWPFIIDDLNPNRIMQGKRNRLGQRGTVPFSYVDFATEN